MKTKSRTLDEKLKVTLRGEVGKDSPTRPKRAKGATRKEAKSKEAGAKVAQFYSALRSRNAEIKQWLAADPSRLAALQTDPEATIKELVAYLGISIPDLTDLSVPDEPSPDFDLTVVVGINHLGSRLLQQVWAYISKTRANTEEFQLDPESVVRTVAGDNSASAEETEAVLRAVLIASGKFPEPITVKGFPYLDEVLEELDQVEERRLILRYLDETLEGVNQLEDLRLSLRIRR